MWYQNAVIYSLDVETFMDSNGDGIGDFQGLIDRIDHLENLGVTCVWLQPFFPSPNRDDGYDVSDYYGVDRRLGTLGDFAEFAHDLKERGIRLMLDLVVNHTSVQHPWFQAARRDRDCPYRDYYVWSDEKPESADEGMVFPGVQETTWTWDEEAQAYYFHRFYAHQPDLNITNPAVRREILRIMGYWLMLGVSGFRVDAAPFLVETEGIEHEQDEALYAFLDKMRDFLSWRSGDGALLAEANVAPDKIAAYFGNGDRMHMLFDFLTNQALFLAFARGETAPLAEAFRVKPPIPESGQWVQFLRTHDELDLGRLSPEERQEVFDVFGPDPAMQIYGRGIRRRLASMFGHDPRRAAMAHSLMLSLPGAQVIRYGDEIGMGDDLALDQRQAVRTPMQWSDEPNAGFSSAPSEKLIRPVIDRGPSAYARVNVRAQLHDPNALINRMERLIRARRSCPEIGWGDLHVLRSGHAGVFAHCCASRDRAMAAVHNLTGHDVELRLDPNELGGRRLYELTADRNYPPPGETIALAGYGYRWFRLSAPAA